MAQQPPDLETMALTPVPATLDACAARLGIPVAVLSRLCHAFRFPAAAYASGVSALPLQDAPFTLTDWDLLCQVHQRMVAGESLQAIQRAWQQTQALQRHASLPKGPSFAATLQQLAAAQGEALAGPPVATSSVLPTKGSLPTETAPVFDRLLKTLVPTGEEGLVSVTNGQPTPTTPQPTGLTAAFLARQQRP